MLRRRIYSLHKWMAVGVGIFLIVWILSGILMLVPDRYFQPQPKEVSVDVDFRELDISPADAVAAVEGDPTSNASINWVNLQRIENTMVYAVHLSNGQTRLVDASSGEGFEVSESMAIDIIRSRYPGKADIQNLSLVKEHSLTYPWGPIPAYQIIFEDHPSVWFFVSVNSGDIQRSSWVTRARTAITSMHTFEPLNLVFSQQRYRKGLLIALGGVGLGVAVTGYYMSLPSLQRLWSNSTRWLKRKGSRDSTGMLERRRIDPGTPAKGRDS